MLGGADNPNGELPSYITGADNPPHSLSAADFSHSEYYIYSPDRNEPEDNSGLHGYR